MASWTDSVTYAPIGYAGSLRGPPRYRMCMSTPQTLSLDMQAVIAQDGRGVHATTLYRFGGLRSGVERRAISL